MYLIRVGTKNWTSYSIEGKLIHNVDIKILQQKKGKIDSSERGNFLTRISLPLKYKKKNNGVT